MLKWYYHKIQAVKITRKNFQALKELDGADNVLGEGLDNLEGDWFIRTALGEEIMSGSEKLIPVDNR